MTTSGFRVLTCLAPLLAAACNLNVSADGEASAYGAAALRRTAPEGSFARAVCICGDLSHAGSLRTEARPGESADVGVNGSFSAATGTTIAGSLFAKDGVSIAGDLAVRDDLVTRDDVSGAGAITVGRDLSCGGSVSMAGSLDVGGTARVSRRIAIAGDERVRGRAPYVAPGDPACGCGAFDVAGSVSFARGDNDNARAGLDTDALRLGARTITLETGRYYFANARAIGQVKFRIAGNVTIHVDGDVDLVGAADLELLPGAACDLYVNGSVHYAGSVVAGSAADPSAFRLYVGGEGSVIAGAGEATFYGYVYAPRAEVKWAGETKVVGAIFAKDVSYAGALTVAYAKPSPRIEIAAPEVAPPPSPAPSPPPAADPVPAPAPDAGAPAPDGGACPAPHT
jgi:hypothetical protein